MRSWRIERGRAGPPIGSGLSDRCSVSRGPGSRRWLRGPPRSGRRDRTRRARLATPGAPLLSVPASGAFLRAVQRTRVVAVPRRSRGQGVPHGGRPQNLSSREHTVMMWRRPPCGKGDARGRRIARPSTADLPWSTTSKTASRRAGFAFPSPSRIFSWQETSPSSAWPTPPWRGPPEAGRAVEDAGKGLHVYRRQSDGSWKLMLDIWNRDRPAEPRR